MANCVVQPSMESRANAVPSMLSWRRWLVVLALVVIALFAVSVQAKSASDADVLTYTMKKGDTLIGIANRHFIKAGDYKQVQRLNAIRNPNAIATGKVIQIPRNVLKYRPIAITVASARGPVTVGTAAARSAMAVDEGATVRTGAQGFATLAFDNGSRVSLPSNSALMVQRARTYLIDGSRDVELELVNGGVRSTVQPMTNAGDRTRVRTRHSVTAVRGTEFGTRVDDMGMISEVYKGRVALNPSDQPATDSDAPLIEAGHGSKLTATGERIDAALLSPPELMDSGSVQSGERLKFQILKPITGAVEYRFELATDVSFIDQISDDRSVTGAVDLPSLADGRYYVRMAAVDANGFVGQSVTYDFRRMRSGATASASVDADGYLFKWQVFGARRPDVRFRLYRGDAKGVPLIDEPALSGGQLRLSDLPPGTYVWQIGTRLVDEGDIIENWNAPETLIVSP